MDKDLFGNDIDYKHDGNGKRGRNANPKGYAGRPGSGPDGETCRSCTHYVVKPGGRYRKCGLLRWRWTNGAGTDILAGSPACEKWEPDWQYAEYNGIKVRTHPNRKPEISEDDGKTWQEIPNSPVEGGEELYAAGCFARLHSVSESGGQ